VPKLAEESKAAARPGMEPLSYGSPSAAAGIAAPTVTRGCRYDGRPLRVLHVINRFDVGGMELVLSKLMRGLEPEGFLQRICTMHGFDPDLKARLQIEGKIDVVGGTEDKLQFAVSRLARIMREFRPDIVHSRNWGAIEAIPAARLAGVPVVIHSEHGYEVNTIAGLPLRQRVLRRVFYTMADAVLAVTRELSAFHARQAWIPANRVQVIYNGVDTNLFTPRRNEGVLTRESLGWPPDAFVIGTVGRLTPIKDYGTLLRAAVTLVRKGAEVRVIMVGSGSELSCLERTVDESTELQGRTLFAGAANNVPELLNAMDVFVLPSLSEGLSNTLLEAMASGLPVVATRVGGNPELVEEGRSGLLFNPRDADALGRVLLRLADVPALRRELGAAARRRVLDEFSLERMFSVYRELYVELAHQRGATAEV